MLDKNEVHIAFEILLEEIEVVVNGLNKEAEDAFKSQDYEKAKALIEDAVKLTGFREKVKNLQKEWETIFAIKSAKIAKRKGYKKLKKGLRTTEDAFRIPILESLIELNGRAQIKDVLKKVYQKMKNQLNEYDLSPLPSNSDQKRWENTAQWCRNTMVNEGLLSSHSPRGIWEITEKGRQYYRAYKGTNGK